MIHVKVERSSGAQPRPFFHYIRILCRSINSVIMALESCCCDEILFCSVGAHYEQEAPFVTARRLGDSERWLKHLV